MKNRLVIDANRLNMPGKTIVNGGPEPGLLPGCA